MSSSNERSRRPGLDNEVEGLDCFATEDVEVVDEADDSALADFAEEGPAVPGSSLRIPSPSRRWRLGPLLAAVAVVLVLARVVGVWMTMGRERPVTTVAVAPVTPVTPAAPSVTSPSASVSPVTEVPAAPAIAPPQNSAAAASPRASSATFVEPSRAGDPPASVSSDQAIAPEIERPAPSEGTPPVTIEAPVVVATPEFVKAEPESDAAPAPPIVTPASDRASIERVLQQYQDAYDRLDAPSAAVIWPRVDTRALSRAFRTLSSQDLWFDHCDLDITGIKASAQCTGEIRYVRRVGDQRPRMRRMSWSFALERVSDRWQISQVSAD